MMKSHLAFMRDPHHPLFLRVLDLYRDGLNRPKIAAASGLTEAQVDYALHRERVDRPKSWAQTKLDHTRRRRERRVDKRL
jgi:hypothetical protein